MDHVPVDCLECAARRAVHEREAHDHRCDDRRAPGKYKRQVDREQGAPDGAALSEKEQEEETDDGRRQDEREGDDRIGNRAREAAADLQHAVGERNAEKKCDHCCESCNLERDNERR